MALDTRSIISELESHCLRLGVFERVNRHEPKNAPGRGLTAAIWAQSIAPAVGHSGLTKTSVRVEFTIRIYMSMTTEPQDYIDPIMIEAVDALMTGLSGDFDLGDRVRVIDLLGMTGNPLSATAGYLNQSGTIYRVQDIRVPLLIDEVWQQTK